MDFNFIHEKIFAIIFEVIILSEDHLRDFPYDGFNKEHFWDYFNDMKRRKPLKFGQIQYMIAEEFVKRLKILLITLPTLVIFKMVRNRPEDTDFSNIIYEMRVRSNQKKILFLYNGQDIEGPGFLREKRALMRDFTYQI